MSHLVLVIDDDADQRRFLERTLTASGYRVITAADGQAGVTAAESLRPSAIILDVMMPILNGFQACRALKRHPATADCPVLLLTSKDQATDHYWGAEVGADAYLQKPVDLPELLATLAQLTQPA